MDDDKSIISEAGSSGNSAAGEPPTAISATPTPTRELVRPIQQTRAAAPLPATWPCEERTDGKLCRKQSDSMTALGKLLCQEHREAYEKKWGVKINRMHLMMP